MPNLIAFIVCLTGSIICFSNGSPSFGAVNMVLAILNLVLYVK